MPTTRVNSAAVELTKEQRDALVDEIGDLASDCSLDELFHRCGPVLSVAEQIYRLPEGDEPQPVSLVSREALGRFVTRVIGDVDEMLADDDSARQRERREVLESILDALAKGARLVATLTVPLEYVERFRQALVYEINLDATADAITPAGMQHEHRSRRLVNADLRAAASTVAGDLDLLAQVPDEPDGPVCLRTDEPDALAHACEAMARVVVGPRLAELVGMGPFEDDLAAQIADAAEAVKWATANAIRFHDEEQARREAVAA